MAPPVNSRASERNPNMLQMNHEHTAGVGRWESLSRGSPSAVAIGVALLIVAAVAGLVHSPLLIAAALLGVPILLLIVYVLWSVFHGDGNPILLGWVFLFPFGYYFLSYPREHPIVTLDRVVVFLLLVTIGFAPRRRVTVIPSSIRRAALTWASYLLIAAVSMIASANPVTPYKARIFLEALIMPALLGWFVIRNFSVGSHLRLLHILLSVAITFSAGIGAAEMLFGRDLLPLGVGHEFPVAGTAQSFLVRPHGSVTAPHSFALIGMFSFCFILFIYRAAGDRIPRWQRILNGMAVFSALACALMPLIRGVIVALVVVALLDLRYRSLFRRRLTAINALGLIFAVLVALEVFLPAVYDERASLVNVFGRVAQHQQTLVVFLSHPIIGVGFAGFSEEAARLTIDPEGSFRGVEPVGSPHNNLGSVLAETGLLGCIPFVASQVFLVAAFLRPKRLNRRGAEMVWPFFLSIFVTYWVMGMDISAYQSSDLNLSFIFTVACLYKYALTSAPLVNSSEAAKCGS